MSILKRVSPSSVFKVGLIVYGFVGLIIGVVCALLALAGVSFVRGLHMPFTGALAALFAVIVCPIVYGVIGAIFAAIAAAIYNLAAGWVGGLEVEIT